MQTFFILFVAGVLFYVSGVDLKQPVTLGHAFAFFAISFIVLDEMGVVKRLTHDSR